MYDFDETLLLSELKSLPDQSLVALAAAAATRQLANYERFAQIFQASSVSRPREIVLQLWAELLGKKITCGKWTTILEEVMLLLPAEDENWAIEHALADHALSCLAYSIRCLLDPAPKETAWALRRAYEASDQVAVHCLRIQVGLQKNEDEIKSHEIIQRELERQNEDLVSLIGGHIDQVKCRAFERGLLTDQEVLKWLGTAALRTAALRNEAP